MFSFSPVREREREQQQQQKRDRNSESKAKDTLSFCCLVLLFVGVRERKISDTHLFFVCTFLSSSKWNQREAVKLWQSPLCCIVDEKKFTHDHLSLSGSENHVCVSTLVCDAVWANNIYREITLYMCVGRSAKDLPTHSLCCVFGSSLRNAIG